MTKQTVKKIDFLGNEWEVDCVGCAIARQSMQVPGDFIQNAQFFCVHQDPAIPLPGFLVIGSKRHIQSISQMEGIEYEELAKLIRATNEAIKKVTRVESLTIIQEESSKHFHLWFFPWTPDVVERYGKPSLTKIREIMADYRLQKVDDAEWKCLKRSIEMIRTLLVCIR